MLLSIHTNTAAEYGALFLVVTGTYSAMPVIVCWFTMNLGGHHRRAVGTAWQISKSVYYWPVWLATNTNVRRFRQYWRHHCCFRIPQEGCTTIHSR